MRSTPGETQHNAAGQINEEDEDVRKVLTTLMVVLGILAFGGFLLLAGFLVFVVSGMDPTR